MRIAYVSDQLLPQTATDTVQTMSMVSALGALGHDVEMVLPRSWLRSGAGAAELARAYGVAPTFRVTTLRGLVPTFRGLEKLTHAARAFLHPAARVADVVYTRNLPVVLAALRMTDRPVVYETYRPWPDQKPSMARRFRRLARERRLAGLVLHSRLAAESYLRVGFQEDRLLVAHNGFDPGLVDPAADRVAAKGRVGLDPARLAVVYTGRVSPKKGLDQVLDLARDVSEATFVLVGSEGEGPIERRARTLANVVVAPWRSQTETVPWLEAADVLLVPPTAGPLERVGNTVLPIKTFLYMAVGRPILAPDTPDLREVLVSGDTALLVRPDDPAAALEALRRLLDDASLRERLGLAAAAAAAERTWPRRAEKVGRFVEERIDAVTP